MFPKEGYDFYVLPRYVVPLAVDWALALLFALLAMVVIALLISNYRRFRFSQWLLDRPTMLIFVQFFFIWWSFTFLYHGMFQTNPQHFKVTGDFDDARMFQAIDAHQGALNNIREAQNILILTVASLRNQQDRQLLSQLAKGLHQNGKSVYATALFLSVVEPPRLMTREEAEFKTRASGDPQEVDKLLRSWESVLKERPGLLSTLPALEAVKKLDFGELLSMKLLLLKWLGREESFIAKIEDYSSTQDSDRLRQYMLDVLEIKLESEQRVDLAQAADAVDVARLRHNVSIKLGAGSVNRFIDFAYFSFLTVSVVGSSDILPNTRYARLAVGVEILFGVVTLVFFASRFLGGAPHKGVPVAPPVQKLPKIKASLLTWRAPSRVSRLTGLIEKKVEEALGVADGYTIRKAEVALKDVGPGPSCPWIGDVMETISRCCGAGIIERGVVARDAIVSTISAHKRVITKKVAKNIVESVAKQFPEGQFVTLAKNVKGVYHRRQAPKNKFDDRAFEAGLAAITSSSANLTRQAVSNISTALDELLLKKTIDSPVWWQTALRVIRDYFAVPFVKWACGILAAIIAGFVLYLFQGG